MHPCARGGWKIVLCFQLPHLSQMSPCLVVGQPGQQKMRVSWSPSFVCRLQPQPQPSCEVTNPGNGRQELPTYVLLVTFAFFFIFGVFFLSTDLSSFFGGGEVDVCGRDLLGGFVGHMLLPDQGAGDLTHRSHLVPRATAFHTASPKLSSFVFYQLWVNIDLLRFNVNESTVWGILISLSSGQRSSTDTLITCTELLGSRSVHKCSLRGPTATRPGRKRNRRLAVFLFAVYTITLRVEVQATICNTTWMYWPSIESLLC